MVYSPAFWLAVRKQMERTLSNDRLL
jgi:hypothetical protein